MAGEAYLAALGEEFGLHELAIEDAVVARTSCSPSGMAMRHRCARYANAWRPTPT
ncbi:hypothetical protein [Nonomuraea typhae]|uniref:hypothetical protein n=1 Tax=Nonomuraea typhae TaxID=2603600 RepID=UPI0012F74F86|nr:hypothetical protein [Nonomuraea typhae]